MVAGQVLPATADDEDVNDALDRLAVIGSKATSSRWGRKEWLDERPLLVRQMITAHASRLAHWVSVSEPALANVTWCASSTTPRRRTLEQ